MPAQARREEPSFFAPLHLNLKLKLAASEYDVDTELNIYPLSALLRQYPETTLGSLRPQLQTLKSLISTPKLLSSTSAWNLPALETVGASLTTAGARQQLSSASLRGVRYLGTFAQDVHLFAKSDVRYLFQGISRDGQYLITLNAWYEGSTLPSRQAVEAKGYEVAPQPANNTNAEQAKYQRAVDAYFRQVEKTLDQSSNAAEIKRLDQFVLSLQLK